MNVGLDQSLMIKLGEMKERRGEVPSSTKAHTYVDTHMFLIIYIYILIVLPVLVHGLML